MVNRGGIIETLASLARHQVHTCIMARKGLKVKALIESTRETGEKTPLTYLMSKGTSLLRTACCKHLSTNRASRREADIL